MLSMLFGMPLSILLIMLFSALLSMLFSVAAWHATEHFA